MVFQNVLEEIQQSHLQLLINMVFQRVL